MEMEIKNDYGTLQCSFNGISVWFCDNLSNVLLEEFERKLRRNYADSTFMIHHLSINIDDMKIRVFKLDSPEGLPFVSVSFPFFFKTDCDLLKFVNIFSRKKLVFESGQSKFVPNRNYLRLNLHSK